MAGASNLECGCWIKSELAGTHVTTEDGNPCPHCRPSVPLAWRAARVEPISEPLARAGGGVTGCFLTTTGLHDPCIVAASVPGAASEGETSPPTPGIASPSSFTPPPPGPRAPSRTGREYTKRRVRGSFAGVYGAVRSLAL